MPETSVVVRSFNEAEFIADTLDAVAAQSYRDFEVVLVDSGSTDGTLDLAEPRVDVVATIDPRNFTFGYSLNVGCEAASGEYCTFLSAHARPTDDRWLGRMVRHFEDDEVAMVYSNQTGVAETKFSEQRHFDELFGEERKRQEPPEYFANNASSVVRRDLWERRPFDEYLTGLEDVDWAKRVMDEGYVVVYEPDACIYHVHDESWEQVYTRFKREAVAAREIGVRSARERWAEYAALPRDVLEDVRAARERGVLDLATARDVLLFRTAQRAGTASGLAADPDIEAERYELFYGGANRSVVVERPGDAAVDDRPLPEVRPNDVLVGVRYAGVGEADRRLHDGRRAGRDAAYPLVPGHEYVGTVVDAGANVAAVETGDRVVGVADPAGDDRDGAGAYAHFVAAPAEAVCALPPGVDARAATLVPTLAAVADGLERARGATPDLETCAVLGGDVFGHLCARAVDGEAAVTAFEPDTTHARKFPAGVEYVPRPASALEEFDLVVETPAARERGTTAFSAAGPETTVLVVGAPFAGDAYDVGTTGVSDRTLVEAGGAATAPVTDRPFALLEEVGAADLVDAAYPLEEFRRAWSALADREALRPVLEVNGE